MFRNFDSLSVKCVAGVHISLPCHNGFTFLLLLVDPQFNYITFSFIVYGLVPGGKIETITGGQGTPICVVLLVLFSPR